MHGQLTNFEIYGDEPGELAKFYSRLLGWRIEPSPGVDYWRISTAHVSGRRVDGGMTFRPDTAPCGWVNYVIVQSVDDTLRLAERMGASVVRPKTAVPQAGWYAVLSDPQRNQFGIWQADVTAFPMPMPD
jgi:uncharacterized protein